MSNITIQVPSITTADLTPNPINFNATLKISVSVTEKSVVLESYYYYSGDLYSGEI